MRAVIFRDRQLQFVKDAPEPKAKPGEALVRVRLAGICRTDLELTRGYMGFNGILGHEFVGELLEETGDMPKGQRVVGEINCGCGQCQWCATGMERHCPNRTVLGILNREGCMADLLSLPIANLLPVPEEVSDREAVFTEPLAAAMEIFEQVHIDPSQKVAIVGDGKLGLLIALTFQVLLPGPVLIIGHHPERVQEWLSIPAYHEAEIPTQFMGNFDLVVEATGATEGLQTAIRLVKPRGIIALKSTMERAAPLDLTPLVIQEIKLIGSRCGRFAPALQLLKRKAFPLDRLIGAVYPLDEAMEAWETAKRPGTLKVMLLME